MKSKRNFDVLVVGGTNSDYSIRGRKLPGPGETIDGEVFQSGAGGKGANQAVAAARLGARVAIVTCVGRDGRGAALIDTLRKEGVETRLVIRHSTAPTGAAVIMVDDQGEKQILTAPGANHKLSVNAVRRAFAEIRAVRVLLMQFEIPLPTIMAAARLGKKLGAQIVLDPAPPVSLPSDNLLRFIDVIRPNSAEAKALTGVDVKDQTTARKAALQLINRGVRAAAVQAGEQGNLLVWSGGEQMLPKLPVKSVDATGAGDAFAAGLAVALAEGRSFAEAGWFANGAAALATTKLGAQPGLPRREELGRFLRRIAKQV